MKLSSKTKEICKMIESKYKLEKRITKEEKNIYEELLKYINNGNIYFNKEKKDYRIKKALKCLLIDNVYKHNYKLSGGQYFPESIKIDIENKITHILSYKMKINKYEITVEFGILDEDEINFLEKYDQYVEYIFTWIYVCTLHTSGNCLKTLTIRLFLTEYKKMLPKNSTKILGPSEINTGYTYRCVENNEIVIYRDEEWKKVLVHETLHTFGLDMSSHDSEIKKALYKFFPIKSEFLLSEAYVEFWGRIINVILNNYFILKKNIDSKKLLKAIKYGIEIEKYYSIYQSSKVLDYMGLIYNDIICHSEKNICLRQNLYREKTNVFSYYILTAILFYDYKSILILFKKNNKNLLKFNSTRDIILKFINSLLEQSRKKRFISNINKSHKLLKKNDDSLRMSVIDSII